MKHTPGPWGINHFNDERGDYCTTMIVNKLNRTIVKLIPHHGDVPTIPYGGFKYSDEDLADARLIAAAPELLEALHMALKELNRINKEGNAYQPMMVSALAIGLAETVINKAEGNDK